MLSYLFKRLEMGTQKQRGIFQDFPTVAVVLSYNPILKNKITFPFVFQWNLPEYLVTSFKFYRVCNKLITLAQLLLFTVSFLQAVFTGQFSSHSLCLGPCLSENIITDYVLQGYQL